MEFADDPAFEEFGKFFGDTDVAVGADFCGEVGEAFFDAVAGFVENAGMLKVFVGSE